MSDKHLLWWIFKVAEYYDSRGEECNWEGSSILTLEKEDFEKVNAPEWVWVAFEEKIKEFNNPE